MMQKITSYINISEYKVEESIDIHKNPSTLPQYHAARFHQKILNQALEKLRMQNSPYTVGKVHRKI